MSMICKKMNMSDTCRWNTFPYKWVCTKTAFDRYEKGNLEMASTRMSIGSSKFAQLFFNIFYFSCLFFPAAHMHRQTHDDKKHYLQVLFKFTFHKITVSGLQNSMKGFTNFHALRPHG